MNKTREKIMQTAFQVFCDRGFHDVGVDLIAKYASVTRQTLYNYFDSKEEIILELLIQQDYIWRDKFKQQIRDIGCDPESQLRGACAFLLTSREGHLFICAGLTFLSAEDPIHQIARRNLSAIQDIIAGLARRVGIEDHNQFATLFYTIIEGAYTTRLIDARQSSFEAANYLTRLIIDRHLRYGGKEHSQ